MRNRLSDLLKTPQEDWELVDEVFEGGILPDHRITVWSVPDTTKYAEVENDIHQQHFPRANEVSLKEIRGVVTVIEFGEAYDVVKLCLIYMLNWILMGVDVRFKIPVWQFRLVEDLDAFDVFPWGTHVYRHSVYSLLIQACA
ncbi:hypothetical protein Ddye_020830 [Dipteronia dyeriana]|uniref:DUF1985 domain-containing protein n=1 Tax=Dipteronia dyeriana TaxID=168575 RepID=A0AAD9U0G4_9ROSI|nr:hypothetical protein Ddye_020830 [Dipteronia dyeriana]